MEEDERPRKLVKVSHGQSTLKGQLGEFQSHSSVVGDGIESKPQLEQSNADEPSQSANASNKSVSPAPDQSLERTLQRNGSSVGDFPSTVTLSKNQQKKLRKKMEWESKRSERKAVRKEKLVAKRERKRAAKFDAVNDPESENATTSTKAPQQKAVQLPITFLIDCDFDDLMRDNERISLASQMTRCYSDNKNSLYRAHLTFCSFGGKLRERFDTVLSENYKSWRGVRALDCDFAEAAEKAREWMTAEDGGVLDGSFSKFASLDDGAVARLKQEGEIVYLSSEADHDLLELKPYSTYVIGGLVDKNREKGLCHKRATARGVTTARLPIGEFMKLQSRKVLATNHVNEIMVRWLENGDWGDAFMRVIPKRKGGTLKDSGEDQDHEDGVEVPKETATNSNDGDQQLSTGSADSIAITPS